MKASDLFVKCLENEGVEYIFGIPGEEILDLLNSLSKSKIKFIPTRHEQGAAFMANVYGRLTGMAGVCLATLGPGATNLITGVADAQLDKAPLVAITGQLGAAKFHKNIHQYVDIVQTFKYITKWNRSILRAETIPEIIRKSFKIAKYKHAATHIEFPEDVAEVNVKNLKPIPRKQSFTVQRPHIDEIKKAVKLLKESKKPVIIAGNAVLRNDAGSNLLKFAKKLSIPIVTTFMGKGAISAKEDLHIGSIGLRSKDYSLCPVLGADLVLSVGNDVVEFWPSMWKAQKNKKIIHINSRYSEVSSDYVTSADLLGDIKTTLNLLTKNCNFNKKLLKYSKNLKTKMDKELLDYKNDNSYPIKPQRVVFDLRSALKDDDILICDVGAHKVWLGRLYPTYKPKTFIVSNGLAAMGIALPGAIAAKLVYPKRKVVAVVGDGGFLMNSQELETAKRLNLDLVVVIFNDSKYGVIEWHQKNKFKKTYGVDFTNPDFVKLAESYGCNGYRVKKAQDLLPTIKKTLNDSNVSVIDVRVDYSENLKLSKKLSKLVCPI